ncbi:probable 3-keto-steroid reductase [Hanseniaspora guilliermondii]|uniref:3beta-hydroxysteroid 3-dehydrogenase n=1 Tax=Hanseniaspora guilliermondii TaxID=56406 RepID=A0A1L0CZD9_9ASCO|nr:probable 3-keto-steroid reductase [Hanseniaspora guilliermondii]
MSKVAVITGTNSNLGLNIAYRLLEKIPFSEDITIVVTSRTLPRVRECIELINQFHSQLERSGSLSFDYILVDFTDMVSVLDAYNTLSKKFTRIDYFFVNAAQGAYSGIDWLGAVKEIISNPMKAVTNPNYKMQKVGVKSRDGMGLVFQANVFGPYYLIQKLKPLMIKGNCRVIWVSSLTAKSEYLKLNDLQLLENDMSYEASKREVDVIHFLTCAQLKREGIHQYLTHPGIFTSRSFYQYLNIFTYLSMLALFYIARFFGSPWHNISGYKAANAIVHCATSDVSCLDMGTKYGSATTKTGKEYIDYDKSISCKPPVKNALGAYLELLKADWDLKLKDQIKDTRKA